jgi:hypothetical protein
MLRPYIHIGVVCPDTGKHLKAVAILDTGADETAFPYSFADILGFDLSKSRTFSSRTAGGNASSIEHSVILKAYADGHEIEFPEDSVRFMQDLHIPILGVRTFLKYFTVVFDYFEESFTIEMNDHAASLKLVHIGDAEVIVDEATFR